MRLKFRVCCYIFLWLWIAHQLAWFPAGGSPIPRVCFGSAIIAFEVVWIAGDIIETLLYLEKPRF